MTTTTSVEKINNNSFCPVIFFISTSWRLRMWFVWVWFLMRSIENPPEKTKRWDHRSVNACEPFRANLHRALVCLSWALRDDLMFVFSLAHGNFFVLEFYFNRKTTNESYNNEWAIFATQNTWMNEKFIWECDGRAPSNINIGHMAGKHSELCSELCDNSDSTVHSWLFLNGIHASKNIWEIYQQQVRRREDYEMLKLFPMSRFTRIPFFSYSEVFDWLTMRNSWTRATTCERYPWAAGCQRRIITMSFVHAHGCCTAAAIWGGCIVVICKRKREVLFENCDCQKIVLLRATLDHVARCNI